MVIYNHLKGDLIMEMLTDLNYKEVFSSGKIIFVDFFANWCGPCKMLSPIVEELANERDDVEFYKVDVDECEQLPAEFGIRSIPTIVIIKDNKVLKANVGFVPKDTLNKLIDDAIALTK
jgi:thioredoxin 1